MDIKKITPEAAAMRRERNRRYYKRHREEILANCRAKREKDPEAFKQRQQVYRASNPELVKKWRENYNAKRRAAKSTA